MEREYNVILKKGVDYDQFGNDMITITNKDGIPNREIEIANARLGSYRQTHYLQIHRSGPAAFNHWRDKDILQFRACRFLQGIDLPLRQKMAKLKGHIGRLP